MEETRVPGEKPWPVASHWQSLSRNVALNTPCNEQDLNHNFSGDRHLISQVVENPTTLRSRR